VVRPGPFNLLIDRKRLSLFLAIFLEEPFCILRGLCGPQRISKEGVYKNRNSLKPGFAVECPDECLECPPPVNLSP
jgi:hypothetical protein